MARANDEGLLIAQIETARGVENVERIAAVDGIDVLWIGHFDLTNSLGIPGQFDHPELPPRGRPRPGRLRPPRQGRGVHGRHRREGRQALAQGFRCLAYWGDLWIYRRALQEGLAALRAAVAPGG